MPPHLTLILALAPTQHGIEIAGMTTQPDPATGLRWVRPRPVRGNLGPEDLITAGNECLRPFDVVELDLIRPQPLAPHVEDWLVDPGRQRPRIVRRLAGERRASFLRRHLDRAPRQVLAGQQRSLCLVKPDWAKGSFRLDPHSGVFVARLAFGLEGHTYLDSYARGGLPVIDPRWSALGRAWLPDEGGWTDFGIGDLEARFGLRQLYLVVGLNHTYRAGYAPRVLAVHTLPEYTTDFDYDNF